MLRQDLEEALADLRATPEEAVEQGYARPTALALAKPDAFCARCMRYAPPVSKSIQRLTERSPSLRRPRHSVMVICESNGGALCTVNMDGEHRRARYSTADNLPDDFCTDALDQLAHSEVRALEGTFPEHSADVRSNGCELVLLCHPVRRQPRLLLHRLGYSPPASRSASLRFHAPKQTLTTISWPELHKPKWRSLLRNVPIKAYFLATLSANDT